MPMFGNILSCGGWIQAALDTNTRLKRVYLAGPPSMEAEADRERVVGINEEELKTPGCISRHLKNSGLPLYISLDKDILTRSCAITNWDQGEAQLEDVLACIKEAASCRSIIGVDVIRMTRNRREIGPAKRIRIRIGRLFVNYWKYAIYCVHDSRKNFEGIRLQE